MTYITDKVLQGFGAVPSDPLTKFVSQWYPQTPVVDSPARLVYLGFVNQWVFGGSNIAFFGAPVLGQPVKNDDWTINPSRVAVSLEDAFLQPDGSCGRTGKPLWGAMPLVKLNPLASLFKFDVPGLFGASEQSTAKVMVGDKCDSTIVQLGPTLEGNSIRPYILFSPISPVDSSDAVGSWFIAPKTPFQLAIWGDPTRLQWPDVMTLVLTNPKDRDCQAFMDAAVLVRWAMTLPADQLIYSVNGVARLSMMGRWMLAGAAPMDPVGTQDNYVMVPRAALFDLNRADLHNEVDPIRSTLVLPSPSDTPESIAARVGPKGDMAFVYDHDVEVRNPFIAAVEKAAQGAQPVAPPGPPSPPPPDGKKPPIRILLPIEPATKAGMGVGPLLLGVAAVAGAAYWYKSRKHGGAK